MPTSKPTGGQPKPNTRPLSCAANAYVWMSLLTGAILLVSGLVLWPVADPLWLAAACVAVFVCSSRRIRLSEESTISTGFVIVFAALIRLGPTEALVVAAGSGLALTFFNPEGNRNAAVVVVFGASSLAVTAWVAGLVYALAGGSPEGAGVWTLGVPAFAAAIAYHLVNCAVVSGMGAVASGAAFRPSFRSHIRSAAPAYYAGAGWAVAIHLAWQFSGVWIVLAAAPLLLCIHHTLARRAPTQAAAATDASP